jgi:hypothetical protein
MPPEVKKRPLQKLADDVRAGSVPVQEAVARALEVLDAQAEAGEVLSHDEHADVCAGLECGTTKKNNKAPTPAIAGPKK